MLASRRITAKVTHNKDTVVNHFGKIDRSVDLKDIELIFTLC